MVIYLVYFLTLFFVLNHDIIPVFIAYDLVIGVVGIYIYIYIYLGIKFQKTIFVLKKIVG